MARHIKYHSISIPAPVVSITILLLFLAGCSSAKMVIPHVESNNDGYQVNGLKGLKFSQDIEFGPYAASDINWYWTGEMRSGEKGEEMSTYGRNYEFRLTENDHTIWDVTCRLESNRSDFERVMTGIKYSKRSYLKCEMKAEDGSGRVASLHLTNNENKKKTGRIGFGTDMIEVSSRSGGGLFGGKHSTTGYHIRLNHELVSAIDVMSNGTVWFDASISSGYKNLISASAMALLLHDEIISMK